MPGIVKRSLSNRVEEALNAAVQVDFEAMEPPFKGIPKGLMTLREAFR